MKKLTTFLIAAFLSGAVFAPALVQAVDVPSTKGQWGFGIRGGVSAVTQDIAFATTGDAGLIASAILTYGVTDWITVGFNAEWETHAVKVQLIGIEFAVGDAQTVSLIPVVEVRMRAGALAPYAVLGAGININSFDEGGLFAVGIKADPKNTFALKLGAGADYFVTPAVALNTELGWKHNDGELNLNGLPDNNDVSAFSALLGFRYYF